MTMEEYVNTMAAGIIDIDKKRGEILIENTKDWPVSDRLNAYMHWLQIYQLEEIKAMLKK